MGGKSHIVLHNYLYFSISLVTSPKNIPRNHLELGFLEEIRVNRGMLCSSGSIDDGSVVTLQQTWHPKSSLRGQGGGAGQALFKMPSESQGMIYHISG